MGNLKNTHPEYFAANYYSRSKPSFSELGLWLDILIEITLLKNLQYEDKKIFKDRKWNILNSFDFLV